ncbi:protein ALP1-like isoform X1 [Xyrichtys novacula]|uniref:Protein ALP1-like isoform X1 n=1 Tax=Xyrichtys novacula TaxID=13765 RepID=A0AAV1GLD7_XYRNO|nr:protein ALP1-like isoform X1 [Xyrichtys novacula]
MQTRPLNCRLNTEVPVLRRFFAGTDTREDLRLSRESLAVLLDLLYQERRHGWGATIETLVLLFWLASGASYRVVSRVFGIPRFTVHRIVHRVTEEVVAIRHRVTYLLSSTDNLAAVTRGFAGLARHRAFLKAAGAIDGCHVRTQRFYGHHARALSVIECAFGMMKTRFCAIFLKALEIHHTFMPQVFTACAILHNSCLGAGDTMASEEDMRDGMPGDEVEDGLEAVSGARWRDRLSAEVSALEEPTLVSLFKTGMAAIEPALQTWTMWRTVETCSPNTQTTHMISHCQ